MLKEQRVLQGSKSPQSLWQIRFTTLEYYQEAQAWGTGAMQVGLRPSPLPSPQPQSGVRIAAVPGREWPSLRSPNSRKSPRACGWERREAGSAGWAGPRGGSGEKRATSGETSATSDPKATPVQPGTPAPVPKTQSHLWKLGVTAEGPLPAFVQFSVPRRRRYLQISRHTTARA